VYLSRVSLAARVSGSGPRIKRRIDLVEWNKYDEFWTRVIKWVANDLKSDQ